MFEITDKQVPALRELCGRYQVRRLDLFGSAATDEFDPATSDLDFLVTFDFNGPVGRFRLYFGLKEELEALFGRNVDLVCDTAIKNRYFRREVDRSRKHLYAA